MSQRPNPVMSARRRAHGPQIGVRLMETGRPSMAAELTPDEYDQIDEGTFRDFMAWDTRRTQGGVAYHLGDYSIREVFAWMRWLKCYVLSLQARLRESKNARHLRETEAECRRLATRVDQLERAPDTDRVRRLRAHVRKLEAEMQKWGMRFPKMSEFDS